MVIGQFSAGRDGGWVGRIRTLVIDAKIRLVPNDDRRNRRAPAFRVLLGAARIGDAWEARTSGPSAKDYLRVIIDDPSLPERVDAAMFMSEEGDRGELLWSRRKRS